MHVCGKGRSKESEKEEHEYGKRSESESSPNILLTFSSAKVPGYEKGGAHSYAIKCRLPCQATDGSPAAYWKDISFGRVPPIQLIHANFPRGCGNLFCRSPPSRSFPPRPVLRSQRPSTSLSYSAENSRRRETHARDAFRSSDSPKMRTRRRKAVFTTRLTTTSYIMKIFSPSIYFCVRPSTILRNANLISGGTWSRMASTLFPRVAFFLSRTSHKKPRSTGNVFLWIYYYLYLFCHRVLPLHF